MAETTQEQPTRLEAVKQVLTDLGKKTMPSEIVTQLKERFDLEIKPHYASKLRTQILGKRKKKAGKKPAAPKEEATPAPVPVQVAALPPNGKAVLWDDILALQGLVERIGAEELRTLIDMMGGG